MLQLNGTLILPSGRHRLRGVICVIRHGVGPLAFEDSALRQLAAELGFGLVRIAGLASTDSPGLADQDRAQKNAALGSGEGVLALLTALARASGQSELGEAPIILWGHSAAGSFAKTFGGLYPERTAAFIAYNSNSEGMTLDIKRMATVPALIMAGGKDEQAGTRDSEGFWKAGRALGAAWTLAIDPGARHGSPEDVKKSFELTVPWIRAVVAQRLAVDGRALRAIAPDSGWRADHSDSSIAPYSTRLTLFSSWLPDEQSGRAWQAFSSTK